MAKVLDEGEGLMLWIFFYLGGAPVGGYGVAMWCLARIVPRLGRRDGVVPGQRSVVSSASQVRSVGVWPGKCCLPRRRRHSGVESLARVVPLGVAGVAMHVQWSGAKHLLSPSVASVGCARWIPSVCCPGKGCLPRASQLARDVLSPSALQAVPPGQRGRVLGQVEGVVSLPVFSVLPW